MGRRLLLSVGLAVLVAGVMAPAAGSASLPVPAAFSLPASNGYSLHAVWADGDPRGERDALLLFFSRKGSAAIYSVQQGVEATEDSISADLGALGSIDLRFVPTGQPRGLAPSCDPKQSVTFESGSYEGGIEFKGEEGFTEEHATSAPGNAQFFADLLCGGEIDEGFGGHSPGARLLVHRHRPGGNVSFEAWKNSPVRPAHFEASIEERRGPLAISRGVDLEAQARSFEFNVPAQSALVRPPSPFEGSARFVRPGQGPGSLRGGLEVDFPGRSNVSLAGARGGLLRYVNHPGHPFSLTASQLFQRK